MIFGVKILLTTINKIYFAPKLISKFIFMIDSANAHQTIRKLENHLDVVSEGFEEKLSVKVKEIKSLTFDNSKLKNEISEAEKLVDKISRDHEDVSNLVSNLKKEATKKENAINKMKAKKEDLEKSVLEIENLNVELLT